MKIFKFIFLLIVTQLILPGHTIAQNISISNDSNYSPDSSAVLDVMSSDKGILIPRVSTVQRMAISRPANGLLVFDADIPAFCYYDGTSWQSISSKAYIDSIKLEVKLEIWAEMGLDDIEGHHYQAVKIGNQVWMANNLRTTKYNDGIQIPPVTDNTSWSVLTTPAYCWYMNDSLTYSVLCGALYNWYAVNSGNLCPANWHVPSDYDWAVLIDYLGGSGVAGGKLKETGTSHWLSPNTGATNDAGFTAIPGGFRYNGSFWDYGYNANWWSSTENTSADSWARKIFYYSGSILRDYNVKNIGFSVRCLRN